MTKTKIIILILSTLLVTGGGSVYVANQKTSKVDKELNNLKNSISSKLSEVQSQDLVRLNALDQNVDKFSKHNNLLEVTEDQHHPKIHVDSHKAGGDDTLLITDAEVATNAAINPSKVSGLESALDSKLNKTGGILIGDLTLQGSGTDLAVGGGLSVTGSTVLGSALQAGSSSLLSLAVANNTSVGGTLNVTGATTLAGLNAGSTTISSLTSAGTASFNIIGSSLVPSGAFNLGSLSNYWDNAYITNLIVGSADVSGTLQNTFTVNTDNATADTEDSQIAFERGTFVPNAILKWDSTNDRFDFNQPVYLQSNITVAGNLTVTGAGASLPVGSIDSTEIADSTIASVDILDGTIASIDIGTDVIVAGNIALGGVGTSELADGTIASADIGTDVILAGNIAADAVGTSEILDGTIATIDIAADAVTDAKVVDALTINTSIAGTFSGGLLLSRGADATTLTVRRGTDTTPTANIMTVTTADGLSSLFTVSSAGIIGTASVNSASIVDGSIASADILDGSIASADILDGSIASADILDGTIVTADIAVGAITSALIFDGTIVSADIADLAITTGKVADAAITQAQIKTKAVVALADADATLTAAQMIDSGIFTITPTPTVARTLTTDTAANIVAGLPRYQVGTWFDVVIVNTDAFDVTLAGGTGVTIVGKAVINNVSGTWRARIDSATAVTFYRM